MLTAAAVSQDGNYEKYYATACFDAETFKRAKALFEEYRSSGVILNEKFSDREWKLTNQLSNTTINFRFDEQGYRTNANLWIMCDYSMFIESIKAYAMFKLGSVTIWTIREIVNSFRKFVELTQDSLLNAESEYLWHFAEFLVVLPGESARRDTVIEALEEKQWNPSKQIGKNRQRVLSELGTYFKFNDAMQDFWKSASGDEKLFWFPLYLWWTLTAILPLRTTEFLLTPRECLTNENGKTFITLRRSRLKGSGGKLAYRVDKDYEIVRYVIPDKISGDITWYLKSTEDMPPTVLSTLFVKEPHYARFYKKPYTSSAGYYTYANLSTCLRLFQEEIMQIDEKSKIRLGDTRHLAMIGLILSGGSPLICKELAGHNDINVSAHYYSNISSFIECATYEAHLKSRASAAELAERGALTPAKRNESVPLENGFCDSEAYGRGEIYDCVKSVGVDGELGNCLLCPHFIDGKSGVHFLYSNPAERKNQVDRDSQYLLETLEAVRRGIGLSEDIQSALLRLQQSGVWYGRSLKNDWEVTGYGKTEKNDNRADD